MGTLLVAYVFFSAGMGAGESVAKKVLGEQWVPALLAGLKTAIMWPYIVYQLFKG